VHLGYRSCSPVRASRMLLAFALLASACGGSTPTGSHTPSPSSTTATPSADTSPIASPTTGVASLVHCAAAVPAGDNLVIGTVAGDATVVVRDIQDPAPARNLCTFDAAAPGRGISPDEDDSFLSFSPDGQYIAYFQTFHTGGSGATAPDQVRRASDGSLVYSTSGVTMAVWASLPSRLFFRDGPGNVRRWDASAGATSMTSLHWVRPHQSPDGRWIAYVYRVAGGLGAIGFYSVQANSV